MGVTTWTAEQDAILRHGIEAHQTYSQIAKNLGVSKAMVSGRIHRLRKTGKGCLPPKPNTQSRPKLKPESHSKPEPKFHEKLNWNPPSIPIEKPKNSPVRFNQLGYGLCSWCVDDEASEPGINMMCCAAPVMDKSKREGDRRSSHCAYHYEMSRRAIESNQK